MSAAEALKAARTVGIELALDGNSLVLEAASEPPAVVLESLSRHKAEIIAMLRHPAACTDHVSPPLQPDVPPKRRPSRADKAHPDPLTTVLAAAKKAGVTFMERVSDGELVIEGLDYLAPDVRQKLQANLHDIRNELLPDDTSTASSDLLAKLGIEFVYVDTEQRAAAEVQRICGTSRMLALDIETAPLPAFLPKAWPIAVTKDGRRSKLQASRDTLPALDPFRAEIRLLQVAGEIDSRTVVLFIDLRHVPLSSSALALQTDRAQS